MEKTALEKIKEAIDFEKQGGSYYVITKLCNIASKIFENYGKFEIFLQTPFGVAKILITQKDDSLVLGSPCKYIDALKKIEKNDITKKLEYTEKILKYLSILDNENIKDIDGFNQSLTGDMTTSGKMVDQALTNFCGMLMFSEPYRFKDGGRSVRCHIKAAIKELKQGNDKALSKFFGKEGSVFKGQKEAEAVYAHERKYNDKNNKRRSLSNALDYKIGGKRQYSNFINNERFDETEESIKDNAERVERYNKDMSENKDHYNKIKITELPRFTRLGLKKVLNGSTEKNGVKTRRQRYNLKERARNYQVDKDKFYRSLSKLVRERSRDKSIEKSRNKKNKKNNIETIK